MQKIPKVPKIISARELQEQKKAENEKTLDIIRRLEDAIFDYVEDWKSPNDFIVILGKLSYQKRSLTNNN